ncbi:L-serine ammonia-lyase, iron-sulfur-dependent, subunit alpha [Adlercreutzia sp. R25]|uniref:L-serine dehydratase n=1 Tax=Adlercreutzia shanghongiae TaxID=3111773 RepID=A0ABU6IXT4_9ACTN|nr:MULTISPECIES: L-serine ammonia-lyase, iron-sulfur-dependent, subunit alpha [unclassified Adlercreutzia]MEC4271666.1 L-serine ammonia-lyase, iron-sulfur-dependent, subunit alpha [Adlercreutzia sp. R25]MEC4294672.1 L-serine ammonia-lyase, iron-sulfur-dependent, subunit alpha [Adlercreutzia sp. R22]
MKTYGLRDIIGPIMVGPSSSHTAGALRIASMARKLFGGTPHAVTFTLYGSFAATGSGHGTDKALVAGIIGLEADDPNVARSFELAEAQGVAVETVWDTATEVDHPNTVDVVCKSDDGHSVEMRGVSIGGGAAVIRRINGIDVDISGEHTSVVVHQHDVRGVLAHISSVLADHDINIATVNLHRTKKRGDAFTVMETDDDVNPKVRGQLLDHPAILGARVIPAMSVTDGASVPVPDDAEDAFARWNYASGAELLALCEREGCTIAEAFRAREEALCASVGVAADVDAYLDRVLSVMDAAATTPIEHPERSIGGLIGGEAAKVTAAMAAKGERALMDPLTAKACIYALATLETNAKMGIIVATPTAGSSGVLPGVMLALRDERGYSHEELREGILAAAAVGYIIARNASVSGAEGGCQAEVGSAAAMAAAGAVTIAGGTPTQALDAASNVIQCLLGLVCDPVGGLVELPCQKRDATAAPTALICAQIALAGVSNLVPFDENVAVMDKVGRDMPMELRETARGGIAAAPSACSFCAGC